MSAVTDAQKRRLEYFRATEQAGGARARLPPLAYVASLSNEDVRDKYALSLLNKNKKRPRRYRKYKRAYKRQRTGGGGGGGGGGGAAIVYPNIVGRGPYHLSGGLSWGNPDSYFRGNLTGGISDTVQGLGAYSVRRNSLLSAVDLGQDPPMVRNTNGGEATVINHREYICDISSGGGNPSNFHLEQFEINPGNPKLFPFLSAIARNFQEYEIRGMSIPLR